MTSRHILGHGAKQIESSPSIIAPIIDPVPPPHYGVDRVELSDHARWLARINQLPEVRAERIAEIRKLLAEDSYATPERIEAALEALLLEFDISDLNREVFAEPDIASDLIVKQASELAEIWTDSSMRLDRASNEIDRANAIVLQALEESVLDRDEVRYGVS